MHLDATLDIRPFADTSSHPHLIRASDGNDYVVKFAENSTFSSIVAEYVCGKLATKFGLSVLEPAIIMLDADFIGSSVSLSERQIRAGLHLGTKRISQTFDLSDEMAQNIQPKNIVNINQVPDMISFDIFVNNKDRNHGNSILAPTTDKKFKYVLLDHGECFGGSSWSRDVAERMKYEPSKIPWNTSLITGLDQFRAPVQRMTRISREDIREIVYSMPSEWMWDDTSIQSLILALNDRTMESMMLCITNNKSMFLGRTGT